MPQTNHRFYTSFYMHSFAMSHAEINSTAPTNTSMYFNLGATKIRRNWEGKAIDCSPVPQYAFNKYQAHNISIFSNDVPENKKTVKYRDRFIFQLYSSHPPCDLAFSITHK